MLMDYIYSDQIDFNFQDSIAASIDLSNFALANEFLTLFRYLSGFLVRKLSVLTVWTLGAHFKDLQDSLKEASENLKDY